MRECCSPVQTEYWIANGWTLIDSNIHNVHELYVRQLCRVKPAVFVVQIFIQHTVFTYKYLCVIIHIHSMKPNRIIPCFGFVWMHLWATISIFYFIRIPVFQVHWSGCDSFRCSNNRFIGWFDPAFGFPLRGYRFITVNPNKRDVNYILHCVVIFSNVLKSPP